MIPGKFMGGGGSPISNPNVAYITSDGDNDTAEIGNPAKPYHMTGGAQAAYNAGARIFDIGAGDAGTLTIAQNLGAQYLFLRGVGIENSEIIIVNHGVDGENGASGSGAPGVQTGGDGTAGTGPVVLTVESDRTIYITADIRGGDGGSGGDGGGDEPSDGGAGGEAGGMQFQTFIGCAGDLSNIRPGDPGNGGSGANGGNNGADGATVDPLVWGHSIITYRWCELPFTPNTFQATACCVVSVDGDFYGFDNFN